MKALLAELAERAIRAGVAALDRAGSKLPVPVRVRTWREHQHDYAAEAKLHERETRRP